MNTFYIQAILTASLGGVLFGYDLGVIAGALPPLSVYFQLTPSQEESIVSLLYFGGGIGAASGGFLCDWFGRKFAIMFTDVMFGLGAFLLYSAETVESVMIGRFVVGWAVAVSGIADVAYLHEISSVWGEGEGAGEGDRVRTEEDRAVEADSDEVTVPNGEDEERRNKHDHDTGGRGSVVSVNEACISLGFLLAYGVAYGLGDQSQNVAAGVDGQASEVWRSMFAFGGFLAAFQFFGMLFMPESPVWLHGKGRIQDAVSARNKIRGTVNTSGNHESDIRHRRISGGPSVDTSSQHMQRRQSIGIEMNGSPSVINSPPSPSSFAAEEQLRTPIRSSRFIECFIYMSIKIRSTPSQIKVQYQKVVEEIWAPYKRQCAIAFFLAASQQFCGHTNILNFSAEIFAMLGQSGDQNANDGNNENEKEDLTAIELTIGIGFLKFLTTIVVIVCVDKGGRRLWLLTGMSCILISLTFLCIAFIDRNDEDIGNVQQQSSSSFKNDLGIVGIYGVAIGYAASFGPLTWLITSELFPSSIRGRALGFATIVTYMAAALVSRTFLSLQKEIGLAACFALYWISTIVSIALVWLGVPDTGGEKTPEEIEQELNDMWIWGGGRHHSRCPSFFRWKSRSGARSSPSSTTLTSLGSYGSNNYGKGVSPDPSLDGGDTGIISTTIVSSGVTHSPSLARRSISNSCITMKEIT
mmetsp:Transcript_41322/g.74488  ORF Transcript_41322/g.74488 Transcript_41322/m.74488 type:complete len:695 (+) Transcript_41322:176-2260(+)|eukprot:CAMPEP_0201877602 /NCGR_PEP_ID=MMETSP0902-20130614/8984_1 /ASSEMBLY_ACC=CAM_ASM_000551 /TAXON_ID=420261 /ORGANISM="Thalassiosira antarctica, Strain CCMP982" /LENGTH=694 /DNA_ID=CAMNT_0048405085 /DNA_START=79 /DNA_END=2163 /DNA_ORIENTATION=+